MSKTCTVGGVNVLGQGSLERKKEKQKKRERVCMCVFARVRTTINTKRPL